MRTIKYKCDRCCSEFDCIPDDFCFGRHIQSLFPKKHANEKLYLNTVKEIEYYGENIACEYGEIGVSINRVFNEKRYEYDLCPACARELKRFLENKN